MQQIVCKIKQFKVDEEIEDYEIEIIDFFEGISEEIGDFDNLLEVQKLQLIDALFVFLLNQNPDLEENFEFVHFIEAIDSPIYEIYESKLIKFNKENGTINSVLLLNRFINGSNNSKKQEYIELMKYISENKKYTANVRERALGFYKYQTEEK